RPIGLLRAHQVVDGAARSAILRGHSRLLQRVEGHGGRIRVARKLVELRPPAVLTLRPPNLGGGAAHIAGACPGPDESEDLEAALVRQFRPRPPRANAVPAQFFLRTRRAAPGSDTAPVPAPKTRCGPRCCTPAAASPRAVRT